MKVLICCHSESLVEVAARALESAGHQVVRDRDPAALLAEAPGAGFLLVDPASAAAAVPRLREGGFEGRTLLLGEGPPETLGKAALEHELDGQLAGAGEPDFPQRVLATVENGRRVLIVDDSAIQARLIQHELEGKGFLTHYAPDAEHATSIIVKRATRPDLVLLDIHMPRVDGAQFCRFLKKNEMFRSIKVLFCSGDDKASMEQLAAECGADGSVSKSDLLGQWIVENSG